MTDRMPLDSWPDRNGEERGLTIKPGRGKLVKSKKKVFVFSCHWPSTKKFITIEARTADEAYVKATKRRDLKGCSRIEFIREKE